MVRRITISATGHLNNKALCEALRRSLDFRASLGAMCGGNYRK
jgi:hypothetical protein